MVVWIIGLSGAGKTTLAREVISEARKEGEKVVLIDGDMIREVFGNDLGHSLEDRRLNADRICRLGKFLESQGVNVVCAILSLFPESRSWNRENLDSYFEVFIDTPLEELEERDSKGIYRKFRKGEIRDVAGLDIEFLPPETPDLVIDNRSSKDSLLSFAKPIAHVITGRTNELSV